MVGIGPLIRRAFGRHEHALAELYRSIYVDLDVYADQILAWAPKARHILEVGCGEGAVTQRLADRFPDAQILAIDITPQVGRLYRGSRVRVTFKQTTVQEVAATRAGEFDLAVISDVIHHVPQDHRVAVLQATRQAISKHGAVVLKDWERSFSAIHWMVYASDRWITGDPVHFLLRREADDLVTQAFGPQSIIATCDIAPWKNNFALLARI